MSQVKAGVLHVAYREVGPADGPPVILLHGFPYAPSAFDEVADRLAGAGRRCIIPFLRGYGPTRFCSPETPRSGQQGALAADLLAFMDALSIESAILAGYDWGGRAACIVAALWPDRVRGLVSGGTGYNLQNLAKAGAVVSPEEALRRWYWYYFSTPHGRDALDADRTAVGRILWQLWSPNWAFDEDTLRCTADAFDNPDFVDVVIHSYRHRLGLAPGDEAYAAIEERLLAQPKIKVPTVNLHGGADGFDPPVTPDRSAQHFTGPYRREIIAGVGHNVPQEAPLAFADAVLSLG